MKLYKTTLFASLFLVTACGSAAKEGEECTADADCEEGLHCHMHDDGGEEDHGECEAEEGEEHEGEDHEGEDHEGEEEEAAE